MFICVTNLENERVYVAVDKICTLCRQENHTEIYIQGLPVALQCKEDINIILGKLIIRN